MSFLRLEDFPELAPLQTNVDVFREELSNVTQWLSWVSDDMVAGGHCQFLDGGWTVFPAFVNPERNWKDFFSFQGLHPDAIRVMEKLIRKLPELFPRTHSVLSPVSRVNYTAYSRLHAGSRLAPHRHENARSFIHHLALQVPEGARAGLSVDGQTHLWTSAGQAVVFDDTSEHSAWNDSDQDRVVYYTDFQREF